MDSPKWWVEQSQIRDLNRARVHDLDQVRAGVLQAALVELRPPNATLTIDLSIIPCTRPKMRKRVGSKCNLQTYLVQPKCRSSSHALKIGFWSYRWWSRRWGWSRIWSSCTSLPALPSHGRTTAMDRTVASLLCPSSIWRNVYQRKPPDTVLFLLSRNMITYIGANHYCPTHAIQNYCATPNKSLFFFFV